MKNILVTGGAGFIGSNFVRFVLKNTEYKVTNFDKLTYAGNLENLIEIESNPNYKFVKGDICDSAAVEKTMVQNDIDTIVNFAAESHVDRSILGSKDFIITNVLGTQTLLDVFKKLGGERFLQVSTDEVYGSLPEDMPELKFTEETPVTTNSPYSASKAGADLLCNAYYHTHGLPVLITRCSNNYGPYQFPEKLIPLMIVKAMNDEHLPVYGDGKNIRDWLYVDDHCSAILAVLERGNPGEVYNIGGNNEWFNIDIVKLILEKLGRSQELITYVKDRPGHDRRYAIDSAKITRELGWEPAYRFPEGIEHTIKWYQENEDWWRKVMSGEYEKYYKENYSSKETHH
ncbi:MAG: dTDP-glucose 4,6-dehydratase [Ignavibacteriaceae bacterium]|mgnify:CR=1 FL=1|jgi:dTDP-glucose 4,6-dehydratase|nr:MAG: dTDP-glucose 4,6-dehydratase [Chlorobiota bacterium]KXK03165.1 MAG: dTDP-D-glucose 4,6-dehydratase [Chlorobi bacterium OLB4]MBV6399624.1 dTDP-glucose 4,6-dehydratase [Ignavibacteria bacterium]MCC6886341.1 dTDP-glucose 4,6-dehydratase [Ignavibacteriales bacterium]MCE7953780.1 dTDP-glucose 4,6-dehydratase [Chlorobi bacterium CHB7]MDL1887714.1 dTDP-glucose 4,6-dehydratase [Ignavibacteria bacterium CHB1]MEB2330287.1 dTDP-glucose 4,6-dehydratase [Ignavibacteriaceae bacterium]OQY76827.1 MA